MVGEMPAENATAAPNRTTLSRQVWVQARALRAEARVLTVTGLILLCIGFPATLILSALALSPAGLSPLISLLAGGPLVLAGWGACAYASNRLEAAVRLEGALAPPARAPAAARR